ncbi:ABC transporter permease [Leucobacter chinensis]|uniref:ABC transporter permease n=1 Tax=Leucobacter chinensis TaxID=2851010 RepID=UPI001C220D38|nr:ABC transporter permease [Leucobacter chinensis]
MTETTKAPAEQAQPGTLQLALREIFGASFTRTVLAIVIGFVVGAVLIVITNEEFLASVGYFFQRPGDALGAAWNAVYTGYSSLFTGSIFNSSANTFDVAIRPFTETLRFAAPLILAGLGIALSFKVGLFNIGGLGQMLVAIAGASWVSFAVPMPVVLHMLVAMAVGVLAAMVWGGIVGLLKAATGAHEVIVTIMMNYIALYAVSYAMRAGFLHSPDAGTNPKTPPPLETAQYPALLGDSYRLHLGFIVAVLGVVLYWWLMERSSLGFRLRAVGENPSAAATSGMKVSTLYIITMALSAMFVGFAGVNQVLGGSVGLTASADSGIGFDAITVALLGGGNAIGIFFAGLLFGAMKAGGPAMQIAGVSPEVLVVVQGVIVLFIAAPPLVRAIFRLPKSVENGPIAQKFSRTKKGGE